MKRIAGLAALLGLVAAACSDSPTAPTDTGAKLRVATPPMGAEAKAAWYKSMGFEQHQTGSSTSGLQYLITPPPFWNTPFGANLNEGDDDCKFVSFGHGSDRHRREAAGRDSTDGRRGQGRLVQVDGLRAAPDRELDLGAPVPHHASPVLEHPVRGQPE